MLTSGGGRHLIHGFAAAAVVTLVALVGARHAQAEADAGPALPGVTSSTDPGNVSGQPSEVAPSTEVVEASIRDVDPWKSWVGLSSGRELVITLRNPGSFPVDQADISLTFGRGPDPTELIASQPLEALQPGEQRTIVVPFDVGPLAFGGYSVKGTVATVTGQRVDVRGNVSAFPWLLLLGAAVALFAPVRHRAQLPMHAV